MDLTFTKEQVEFRHEARDWLEANAPTEKLPSLDTEIGFELHRNWEKNLHRGNWGMVTWPKEFGGRGANLIEWLIFEEEYYRAGCPLRVSQNGIFLLGPTLMEFGAAEQKSRFLPPMAAGDEIWAQAWSEPGAGSDMAAIRTTARRDGDEYVINGQKTWSSRAVFADWCFGIFRTEPDSERHKGLSFILVPLDAEGITIRPIKQLDGDVGFAELFFDEVRVPAANLLGDEHDGWRIAMATAGFERGLMLRSPARFQAAAARLIELCRSHGKPLSGSVRAAALEAWASAEAYSFNTYMTASRLEAGGKIGAEASCNKIFWSELDRSLHRAAMSMLGAHAELMEGADAVEDGAWIDGYMFSLAGPIYAGSNEIQRNIIAERCLGLPRS